MITVTSAKDHNLAVLKNIEKRAFGENAVLGPCLKSYIENLESKDNPTAEDYLGNLTKWLLEAKEITEKMIQESMKKKWVDDPERVFSSVANSLRRSAGTNYQSLVSYALAKYLYDTNSHWYLHYPVPRDFRESLAIIFGLPTESEEEAANSPVDVKVQPDVDILIRNELWDASKGGREPLLLLSIKTSLVDRAGMAARWKTYFDAAQTLCDDCSKKLGIHLQQADDFEVNHGIVTANIYKYFFHDKSYQKGELESGQTKSNTYMFELKFTTRDDGIAVTPEGWRQFQDVIGVLKQLSIKHSLAY
jgi:hypothetical protein